MRKKPHVCGPIAQAEDSGDSHSAGNIAISHSLGRRTRTPMQSLPPNNRMQRSAI